MLARGIFSLTNESYVEVPSSPVFASINAVTVEAMVRPIDFRPPAYYPDIVSFIGSDGNTYSRLESRLNYEVSFHVVNTDGVGRYASEQWKNVPDGGWNKWNHIFGTYDPESGEICLYGNGSLLKTATLGGDLYPVDRFKIAVGWGMSQIVAFVRIYNRVLSEDEIQKNMKHYDNPVRDGLVLWLPFTENMGVIAKDRSDYGNHARLHNCRWVSRARRGMYFDNGGIKFDSGLNIDCNYCSVVAVFAIETLKRGGTIFTGRNCVVKPSGDKLMLYNSHANKKLIFTNYDGSWKEILSNVELEAGQIYTGVGIMNGSEEHIYLASNGVIIDHNYRDDLGDCGEYTNSLVYVGSNAVGGYPLHGEILATMIYNRPISEDEIEQISEINGWFDPPRDGLISWILFDGLKEGDTPVDLITGAEGEPIGTPRFVIKKPIRVLRL